MNLPRRLSHRGARVRLTIVVLAALLAVLGCYLVVLDRVTAQGAAEAQYPPEPTGPTGPALQEVILPPVNICHVTGDPTNPYEVQSIPRNQISTHQAHGDIYPVPAGGCPGPP